MRNLSYFLAAFLVICLIGLSTGCSMPLRKPEPYEQRQQQAQRDAGDGADQKGLFHGGSPLAIRVIKGFFTLVSRLPLSN